MADVEMTTQSFKSKIKKGSPSCVVLLSDFANMLKAFMGANYLTIAYAFTQSGLVPGIIGLILIASVTNHCCHLIVKCKHRAIRVLLERHTRTYSSSLNEAEQLSSESEGGELSVELLAVQKKMVRNMTYGDVGKVAFGDTGLFVVNMCLLFTQFGFCVGYFIFLGNTMYHLFPYANMTTDSTDLPPSNRSIFSPFGLNSSNDREEEDGDFTNFGNIDAENSTDYYNGFIMNLTSLASSLSNISTLAPAVSNLSSTLTPTASIPLVNISHYIGISQAPNLKLLVISPLPFFIGFAFLRDVRHLGFVSVAADVSIFVGCIVTMIVLNVGFELSDTWYMYDWMKYPVFFGMVTSAFEGIGTIIPIESSMEGNRHNFSKFLHGAVFIMTLVLLSFGILGYLRYGNQTAQMINKNMPDGTIGIMINICLCIGVVLTFPLQIYPVIELSEIYIFGNDRICGPKSGRYERLNSNEESDEEEEKENDSGINSSLLPRKSDDDTVIAAPVAATISDEVSTWKRNLLRIVLVIAAGGIAIILRDLYAYVSAFIGAIGSSTLAYILPCMFHLKLCGSTLPRWMMVKDCIIIVFGTIASLVSLSLTIKEVIERTS